MGKYKSLQNQQKQINLWQTRKQRTYHTPEKIFSYIEVSSKKFGSNVFVSLERTLYKSVKLHFAKIDSLQVKTNQWEDFDVKYYYQMSNGIQNI